MISSFYQLTGIHPDPLDLRDYLFEYNPQLQSPRWRQLQEYCFPVENQLSLQSCTGCALVSIGEMFKRASAPADDDVDLSKLFNYYTSRELLPTSQNLTDTGSTARMALRAANKIGICEEKYWPYVEANVNIRPSDEAYKAAALHKVGAYYRIPTAGWPTPLQYAPEEGVRQAIALGYPVYCGLQIGEDFFSYEKGILGYIGPYTNKYVGNHEVVIVGYDDELSAFFCMNSWGTSWGMRGFFYIPQRMVSLACIDLWVVTEFAGIPRVGMDSTTPAPAPAPVPVPSLSASEKLVTEVYQQLLRRVPDEAGLKAWSAALDNGMSPLQFRRAVAGSAEFRYQVSAVRELYRRLLGREASLKDIQDWDVVPLGDVISGIVTSEEFSQQ